MNKKEITDLIQNQEYEKALRILLQDEGNYLWKTQCLYELKKNSEVIAFFEQIVDKIEDDYYEILGYYILALLNEKEYEKALNILNDELSMPYIQDNYLEVLNELYDDVVAQKQAYLVESGIYDSKLSEEQLSNTISNSADYNELMDAIMQLDNFNIRKLLNELESFLQKDQSPVLKTFILEVMIKQQVSEVVLVVKDNIEYEFMPVANQMVFQDVNFIKTRNLLEEHLQKNPSYLMMCLDILDLFVYVIYPNLVDIDEVNYVAAMIEGYVYSLNMEDLAIDFEEYYDVSIVSVNKGMEWLIDKLRSEERFSKETI